ncbi:MULTISPECIES: glycosyl hydrolase family 18 protein [Bacillus]|uniref:glycosyl hydrolase family 18 protein n=1 Tax=Bacillus TaxID=1386 RepID=UPI0020BDF6E0|nr:MULTISPECIES: glycosyl hydrolase family 18 protein [Bacillus]MCK8100519.1 glycosyl hydrolase family 18 protein [Bacillus sp. 2CMS4F]MDP4526484.1 glycosyl hydrolase family 18 protein [Bacillus halotolerans]
MKKWLIIAVSLAIAIVLFMYTKTEAKAAGMTLGYTTGDTASYHSLTKYHKYISSIATDTFAFDKNGRVIGDVPGKQLTYAKKNKIKTWAVISNYNDAIYDFDGNLANQVMTDKTARKRFTDQLISLAKKHHYYGVNIDFEAVNPKDRSAYSSFIQYVSQALKKKHIKTMVSVPAKSADDKNDDWSWPYDYAKIGKYADYVQVMTYDEHGIWGEPGSVASTSWIKRSLQFSVKKIKANKVIMGVPAYGYDWDLKDGSSSSAKEWNDIKSLIKKQKAKPAFNKKTGSMTFSYTDKKKHKHVVWYENEKTIETKSRLAKQYKIAGVSVYALGHESESFWKAIQKGTK